LSSFLGNFFNLLVISLNVAILGRVVMSWMSPKGGDPLSAMLYQVTEPFLAPIRRVLPSAGMFDLSPMVAVLVLDMVILPVVQSIL
jgi:YggT family protein